MKTVLTILALLTFGPLLTFGQSHFSVDAYQTFLQQNQNLTYEQLQNYFPLNYPYYKGTEPQTDLRRFLYLDSIQSRFNLTNDELGLLRQNHFVVSERLQTDCFGKAYHIIYGYDLPVFVSTDAILHALHVSYDQILSAVERSILKPNLIDFLGALYDEFPKLKAKYDTCSALLNSLKDVDLYVTVAYSLINAQELKAHFAAQDSVDLLWNAIQNQKPVELSLFAKHQRQIDFSQFKVRGHYDTPELRDYFKTMMWLGRIDFLLTPPPQNPWEMPWPETDIKRMNLDAFLLNELIEQTQLRSLLEQNDAIIEFMVGESDNLTTEEYKSFLDSLNLSDARQLLDESVYENYRDALPHYPGANQKILSQIMMVDPFSSQPDELPVSFKLMGQRFIVDSYILFNVVYDRIVFEGQKIWRPLPDPLDALFVLGNDDALYLLKDEIKTYHYASQLNALRYLIDSYDPPFWDASLYNVWLNAIRALNPPETNAGWPLFMKTAAWRQCRINAQLASWSQLRHDNLLYAKQSYTGATGCLFPYSYVEPVPEFYQNLAHFAQKAGDYFAQFPDNDNFDMWRIHRFFPKFKSVMDSLTTIAQKELAGQVLNSTEQKWLREMLFLKEESGAPPYSGWYSALYFDPYDAAESDYTIADVHTQPTDFEGNPVGHVLHVGTGNINLGIFLAQDATYPGAPKIAFVGPVMSYYDTVTSDFKRMTDKDWKALVQNDQLPQRPDWVNIYLTDAHGQKRASGRELPSRIYTGTGESKTPIIRQFRLYQNFPNPFNPDTKIDFDLPEAAKVRLEVFNAIGQRVSVLVNDFRPSGRYHVLFNGTHLASGIYWYRLQVENKVQIKKMILLK